MAQTNMSELLRTSMQSLQDLLDANTHIGTPIETLQGDTILPVSRIHVGFATGGVDYASGRAHTPQNFGGGSGGGVSVTPVAFLILHRDGTVTLTSAQESALSRSLERITSMLEQLPSLIKHLKNKIF